MTEQERDEVVLELETLRRHVHALKLNPPASGPFGHNGLQVQLWREHIARAEREVARLEGLLA